MYLEYASLLMLGEQYPLKQKTSPTRTPTIPSLLTSVVSSGSLPLRSVTHIEASPLVSLNQCGSCLFGSEIIIISGLSSIAHWCIMSCASLHLLRFICSILIYSLSTAFYILDKPGIRLRGQISLLSPCCRWSSREWGKVRVGVRCVGFSSLWRIGNTWEDRSTLCSLSTVGWHVLLSNFTGH